MGQKRQKRYHFIKKESVIQRRSNRSFRWLILSARLQLCNRSMKWCRKLFFLVLTVQGGKKGCKSWQLFIWIGVFLWIPQAVRRAAAALPAFGRAEPRRASWARWIGCKKPWFGGRSAPKSERATICYLSSRWEDKKDEDFTFFFFFFYQNVQPRRFCSEHGSAICCDSSELVWTFLGRCSMTAVWRA